MQLKGRISILPRAYFLEDDQDGRPFILKPDGWVALNIYSDREKNRRRPRLSPGGCKGVSGGRAAPFVCSQVTAAEGNVQRGGQDPHARRCPPLNLLHSLPQTDCINKELQNKICLRGPVPPPFAAILLRLKVHV